MMKQQNSIPTYIRQVFTTLALLGILLSSALLPTASARVDNLLAASPTLVKDIIPPPDTQGSAPWGGIRKGNILYFIASDPEHGSELWRSDGTTAGTWLVKDISLGPVSGVPRSIFAILGDVVLFRAFQPDYGNELWRTDGTPEGTWMVKDIAAGEESSNLGGMTLVRGKILFSASDGVHGEELWSTDGTSGGTSMVKEMVPGTSGDVGSSSVVFNDTLIFNVELSSTTFELWRSDGTAAGTVPFYGPLSFGEFSSDSVSEMVVFNNRVYLDMSIDQDGIYLWSTDGTRQGTQKVVFPASPPFIQPATLTPYGNTLYFTGSEITPYATSIWKLQAGTNTAQHVQRYWNQYSWPSIGPFYDMGSQGLVFYHQVATASSPVYTYSPGTWKKLDPTTGAISDVCPDCMYDAAYGDEAYLWYGKLYFPARSTDSASAHGWELWVTDGTAAGTHELFDLNPGAGSSNPVLIRPVDDTMFFAADDGVVGSELWSFDITLSRVYLPMTRR